MSAKDVAAYTWLTPVETAKKLRVSTGQVRRLIANGEFTAMDVSAKPDDRESRRATWRIDPKSVDDFIARRTRGRR